MIMITKIELKKLGFGPSQSSDIIRKAKRLMVNKGFGYYDNRRLGCVPIEAVEEILGIHINLDDMECV
ncbi:DUF3173 domain-containing protein [Clostridium tyrobutyricum]|jgi:hypothetical protein|uniref:DUF3173 domain-containing protein n=1 Tax=Clostridium tyrobutyricum TaxID=1519 RepID=UPI0018AB848F|nr:DUF3173 domain-containing protein [Clostridium tyrobutyricum]